MMAALTLNLHQEATRGGAIGMDPETQALVLSWRMPVAGIEPDQLIVALENFCETADSLRTSLDEFIGEFSDEEQHTHYGTARCRRHGARRRPRTGAGGRFPLHPLIVHQRLNMAGPLDSTLASNVFTAHLPRPDLALGHGIKYLIQQRTTTMEGLAALGRRSPAPDLTPIVMRRPGNAEPMTAPSASNASRHRMETLTCSETGREHPVLPRNQCETMNSYMKAINTAASPASCKFPDGQQDAFRAQVQTTDGKVDLLPPSLTRSTLLNSNLKPENKGQVQNTYPNTLFDPLTGFAASIAVRGGNEVVINFGPLGSQGATIRQFLRGTANILGLTPPKNFAQASKLTQMVKAHLDELNAKLPPGQPQFTLKLAGHSMGGGMATYAALRNDVEAVVFNPLRLGLLARAKVGRPALKNAPNLVTEVVVKSDWVADSKVSRLWGFLHLPSLLLTGRRADAWGAIGTRYLVPKPDEQQLRIHATCGWSEQEINDWAQNFDVHTGISTAIQVHEKTPDLNAVPSQSSVHRSRRLRLPSGRDNLLEHTEEDLFRLQRQ
ncbi:hypothetical protein CCP4SC76_3400001 [Gammaproteobacteria bacterium]